MTRRNQNREKNYFKRTTKSLEQYFLLITDCGRFNRLNPFNELIYAAIFINFCRDYIMLYKIVETLFNWKNPNAIGNIPINDWKKFQYSFFETVNTGLNHNLIVGMIFDYINNIDSQVGAMLPYSQKHQGNDVFNKPLIIK